MYFRSQGSVCLLVACLTAGIACDSQHAFGEDPATHALPQVEWEARIEAALNAKGEWEFAEGPLNEVCSAIQEKLGIEVVLDVKALEDFGIDSRTPITRSIGGISNRSCLRLMLRDLELTFTTRLGALWITTNEYAESQLVTKVYPVGELLGRDETRGEAPPDYSLILQAITGNIKPDSWGVVGGPGAIEGIHDSIVVSQTSDVHKLVAELLAAYRVIISNDQENADEKHSAILLGQQEVNASIRHALDQPFTAEFKDVSLMDVIDFASEKAGIPIVIDVHALEDFGIDTSVPITAKFTETPLHFALKRLLNALELTYIIRNEVLFITTPEQAEESLLIGLYPVRDLVEIGDDSLIEPLGARCDFDSLTNVIQSTIAPDSWDEVGGPSSIEVLLPVPTIVILQMQHVHEQISELLVQLRAARNLEAARSVGKEVVDPAALIVRTYQIYPVLSGPDEIVKLIMRASEPGTWDDAAGTFVQGLGMSIVVKHNVSGHRQVQKLLSQLGVSSPVNRGGKKAGGGGVVAPSGGGGGF
jgi:hypothetical protein